MALKLSLEQKLTQQLIMTPQLTQLIKLLTLSRLELEDRIQTELESNPLLEQQTPPEDFIPLAKSDNSSAKETRPDLNGIEEWFRYLEGTSSRRPFAKQTEEVYRVEASHKPSTFEELIWQVKVSKLTAPEKEIAWIILGNLDDGYLRLPIEELEALTGEDRTVIEKVIKAIQRLEPPGIAARNLVECLLIQAESKYPDNFPLLEKVLTITLNDLEAHRYKDIARKLKVKEKEVLKAVSQITSLDPHPGQEFLEPSRYYIIPDAEIIEEDGIYKIVLNENLESSLRINPFYRTLLRQKKQFSPDERKFLEDKYQSARQLLDGLKRRHSTLYSVLETIINVQRNFFDTGISQLVPLTLKDVADVIGVHETTVSRITRKKYVQTPRGLFSLKFFFGRGLNHADGEVAVKSVMERISAIIDKENIGRPLSDQDIANQLQREGTQIARRTVGKYRKLLKIDSTQRRRRIKKIKR